MSEPTNEASFVDGSFMGDLLFSGFDEVVVGRERIEEKGRCSKWGGDEGLRRVKRAE